ncbi:hypothetical protein [Actinophytocola gossypii]|uniref:Integral membrane protein n=1 Tax=Actinophytocola gossypii TaxID=2812003 RepID=A0ABT2JB02_9PSEU|nr:hypothetical protein [Actinophytocola gossypii]MCT2584956.1 hypothetical protein [Actinophytocola gossypii]
MTITTNTVPRTTQLLRLALTFDGVATGLSGVALLALGAVLDGPLGVPAPALFGAGAFFLGWGAFVLFLGTRPVVDRRGAVTVVVVNLLAALDSVLLVATGLLDLTTLGSAVVLALAVAMAALAALQIQGLRQN